jgi:hypothetical protein
LDPSRGLFDFTGVKGESCSDAKVDSRGKLVLVPCYPVFLFRATEAYPHKVGSGVSDFLTNAFKLILRPLAERRGIGANNICVRIVL